MIKVLTVYFFAALFFSAPAKANPYGTEKCPHMTVYDYASSMCMPYAMEGMPMKMFMLSGNVFLNESVTGGTRGRSALYSTSMIMADAGTNVGSNHYLNVDLMLTAEKWTVPERGYPLISQIGERDSNGVLYLDAQHPHSSPIMGLTFNDTLNLFHAGDYVKVFFAPRGESTDGPIAFMHRPTGMVNPDAPLGHHVGQDVGHISSTVIGTSLKVGETRFEVSGFHGQEPKPESVDLPLGTPNSLALRLIEEFSPNLSAMISGAYLKDPESTGNPHAFQARYSASVYQGMPLFGDWSFQNALISGVAQKYDEAEILFSFSEEFLVKRNLDQIWGRIEVLERTPDEVQISSATPHQGKYVGAITLGYSRQLSKLDVFPLYLGTSVTENLMPSEFKSAYGGNPWAAKVFLQLGGMKMVHIMSKE